MTAPQHGTGDGDGRGRSGVWIVVAVVALIAAGIAAYLLLRGEPGTEGAAPAASVSTSPTATAPSEDLEAAAAREALNAAIDASDAVLEETADGHTWDEDARTSLATMTEDARELADSATTASDLTTMTADLTALTTTVADSARALLADADGRWCPAEQTEDDACFVLAVPTLTYEAPQEGLVSYVYPIGDIDSQPDESTDYAYPEAYDEGGCLEYIVDGYPSMSGAMFLYCPADATLPEGMTDRLGYGPEVERIYLTQESDTPPFLRADG